MRGRLAVVLVLLLGVGLALTGILARGRGKPRLPLEPGILLLLTADRGDWQLASVADGVVAFPNVHGVSSDHAASVGAILTGRMPRENGLVRAGDAIASGCPVVADLLAQIGFVAATGVDLPTARPLFRHVHVEQATRTDAARLLGEAGPAAIARTVALAISLEDPEHPQLALRLPPGLIAKSIDEREVSLLDVAPTLLELFGVPIPADWMEPFLLAPRNPAPRFFLYTRPSTDAAQRDVDAITLLAAERRYSLDPAATPPEQCSDESARSELRQILGSAFHYRLEPPEGPTRARWRR